MSAVTCYRWLQAHTLNLLSLKTGLKVAKVMHSLMPNKRTFEIATVSSKRPAKVSTRGIQNALIVSVILVSMWGIFEVLYSTTPSIADIWCRTQNLVKW
jgi:hypothetical protein